MGYYGFLITESIHSVFTQENKLKPKSESKREHLSQSNLGGDLAR